MGVIDVKILFIYIYYRHWIGLFSLVAPSMVRRAKDANLLTTETFVKRIVETPNAISCVCKFRKILHLEKWAKHGEITVINI